LVERLHALIGDAAVEERQRVARVDPDCFGIVADRTLEVFFLLEYGGAATQPRRLQRIDSQRLVVILERIVEPAALPPGPTALGVGEGVRAVEPNSLAEVRDGVLNR